MGTDVLREETLSEANMLLFMSVGKVFKVRQRLSNLSLRENVFTWRAIGPLLGIYLPQCLYLLLTALICNNIVLVRTKIRFLSTIIILGFRR